MRKRIKAYLLLLITAIIWGFASPVIKYTLQFINPFSFLFWRFLIVSIIFLPFFFYYKNKKNIKLPLKKLLQLGGIGFLGITICLSLLFIGYKHTTAIDGSLIYSVAPIMVIVGGAFLLKEEVTKKEKLGALIAFLGSIVTIVQPLLEGKAFALENILGNVIILFSAVAWAGYCLLLRKTEDKKNTDPFILTAIIFFTGLITIIPFYIWEYLTINNQQLTINKLAIPGVLYMSLFSSIIAYLTHNLGYSLIEASEATVFDYLKPIFAAPLAVVWLGEKITGPFLIGAGLIFLGVILTETR